MRDNSTENSDYLPSPEQNVVNDSQLLSVIDLKMQLNKLYPDLCIKPAHWCDSYWEEILNKYNWFMHKNEHAGCKLCFKSKFYFGKKSSIASMKLYIMNLSYEEFELKLAAHTISNQHQKALETLYSKLNGIDEDGQDIDSIMSTPNRLTRPNDFICHQCDKSYKLKKALVNHIYTCKTTNHSDTIDLPCKCNFKSVSSLNELDEHMHKNHINCHSYICKFCQHKFQQTTVLFDHLFLTHSYHWNAYREFPSVVEIKTTLEMNTESQINGKPDNFNFDNHENHLPRRVIKTPSNRSHSVQLNKPYAKRIFKEVPQNARFDDEDKIETIIHEEKSDKNVFTIPLTSIVVCSNCEARFINQLVLDNHTAKYHPTIINM